MKSFRIEFDAGANFCDHVRRKWRARTSQPISTSHLGAMECLSPWVPATHTHTHTYDVTLPSLLAFLVAPRSAARAAVACGSSAPLVCAHVCTSVCVWEIFRFLNKTHNGGLAGGALEGGGDRRPGEFSGAIAPFFPSFAANRDPVYNPPREREKRHELNRSFPPWRSEPRSCQRHRRPVRSHIFARIRDLSRIICHRSCETRGAIERSRRAFFRRSSKLQVMNSTGVFGNLEQRIIREQSGRKRAVFLLFLFLPVTLYRYHLCKQISIFSHLHMSTMWWLCDFFLSDISLICYFI